MRLFADTVGRGEEPVRPTRGNVRGRIRQLGTPDEIYRRPCERFVAAFVADTNVLLARIERIDATCAIVALGTARIKVASAPLRHLAVSATVDLFVRPEQLRLAELNEPCASTGTIAAQVYQGGHVDIYLECADSAAGRVLARLSGRQAMTPRALGAPVAEHRRGDRVCGRLAGGGPNPELN
jgi:putative spermidine/putrescine transport system ATP-binding protein